MERTRGSGRLTLCYFALVLMALITGGHQTDPGMSNKLLGGLEMVYAGTIGHASQSAAAAVLLLAFSYSIDTAGIKGYEMSVYKTLVEGPWRQALSHLSECILCRELRQS